ncbi:MAG: sugar phosphate isomerase/epimerase [Steroidobacteraceae bacterium]
MNRREAVAGISASAAMLLAGRGALGQSRAASSKDRAPLGVQFFTFVGRNGAEMGWAKYSALLEKVREIGYDGVELAGFSGYKPEDIRKRAESLGLDIPSVHIGFDHVFPFLPPQPWGPDTFSQAQDVVYSPVGVVQLARILAGPVRDVGARFATIAGGGTVNFSTVDNVMRFADGLNKANALAKEKGVALSFHPHAPEFTPIEGGKVPFDLIVANTDPSIRYELDIYWSMKGSGEAPQKTIERFASRIALFHLKDADGEGKIATPGEGTFDFAAIREAGAKVDRPYYFVERDGATDAVAVSAAAYQYLRKVGYGVRA